MFLKYEEKGKHTHFCYSSDMKADNLKDQEIDGKLIL